MHPKPFALDPAVAASLAVAAAITTLLPFVLGYWWKRRTGARWRIFWSGSLVFFVSQIVLRLPWQIPLSAMLTTRTLGRGALWTGFLLFSSLTAGIFEETGRYVGYRTLLKNDRSRKAGVMFGLGHGGLESFLLVGLTLASLLVIGLLASRGMLPAGKMRDGVQLQLAALTPAQAAASAFERLSAMTIQVGLSLIGLRVFNGPRPGLLWLFVAIGIHFAVNGVAVLLLPKVGVWPTEGVIAAAAVGVLSLGWQTRDPEMV